MTPLTGNIGKKRVSVFYDISDWAFHNVAQNMERVAPTPYALKLIARDDWFGRQGKSDQILADSDLAVFLWRFDLLAFLDSLSETGWRQLMAGQRCAFVTIVYDHIYADENDLQTHGNPFPIADCVAASSLRLCRFYSSTKHLPDIKHCVPDGVDLALFTAPDTIAPDNDRPLRIGWVGNSAWGLTLGHDFKGRKGILEPALSILQEAGLPFSFHTADKAEKYVPRAAMPDFYSNIDVLVCSSLFEGTPNPVLEAMASGCAIVSTDVGIVPEILGQQQMEFLLNERSASALATALERLIREPETVIALKRENLQQRGTLGWETRWPAWDSLFEEATANARAGEGATKALAAFRTRHRTKIARLRQIVATNRLVFKIYALVLERWPALIRWSKKLLA